MQPTGTSARWTGLAALLLAAAMFVVGISFATTTASGSDAYGYVNQADQWLGGQLTIDQSWAASAAWPSARWTFAPLAYRPSNVVGDEWLLVPLYSPGLPLVFAAAKLIGGQEAIFWVVPLSGALLVLATFGIGRRLASPGAGLIAAWLVATSPAVLFMLMAPMSDVPVAAAWAVSFYCLLDRRLASALTAGAAAGLAVMIRPNLAPGAAIFGLWYAVRVISPDVGGRRSALLQGLAFSAGAAGGALVVAVVNQSLNGSPLISGYGRLSDAFSIDFFGPNIARYTTWLLDTQTPVVLAGVGALLLPVRALWPATRERLVFLLIVPFVTGLWLMYCLYRVYEEWWFLRFVLASWPFLMVGTGAVLALIARRGGRWVGAAICAAVVSLGVWQVTVAADRHTFNLWKEERRYVTVAKEVRRMTDRQSVIFSMQHSGSLRYYAGRVTVRYDQFQGRWIDRAVDWFAERGIHAYLLLDDWEVPVARETFAGQRAADRLDEEPLLRYRGTSQVFLYDLSRPRDAFTRTVVVLDDYEDSRSVEPVTLAVPELLPPGPP